MSQALNSTEKTQSYGNPYSRFNPRRRRKEKSESKASIRDLFLYQQKGFKKNKANGQKFKGLRWEKGNYSSTRLGSRTYTDITESQQKDSCQETLLLARQGEEVKQAKTTPIQYQRPEYVSPLDCKYFRVDPSRVSAFDTPLDLSTDVLSRLLAKHNYCLHLSQEEVQVSISLIKSAKTRTSQPSLVE